jgi:hypothetical protein
MTAPMRRGNLLTFNPARQAIPLREPGRPTGQKKPNAKPWPQIRNI